MTPMNLFVGNLHPDTTDKQLLPIFSEFGTVLSAKVIKDNMTGISRGFGFVEMADRFEAFDAIDNIDGIYFEGNVISVKEAKLNSQGGPNGRPGNKKPGGFNKSSGGSRPFQQRDGSKPYTPRPRDPNRVYTSRNTNDNFNSNNNPNSLDYNP